ncbi:MAG: hypothetical protein ACP5OM_00875 [Methanothrix sp.]
MADRPSSSPARRDRAPPSWDVTDPTVDVLIIIAFPEGQSPASLRQPVCGSIWIDVTIGQ